jgi:hypothetical protein
LPAFHFDGDIEGGIPIEGDQGLFYVQSPALLQECLNEARPDPAIAALPAESLLQVVRVRHQAARTAGEWAAQTMELAPPPDSTHQTNIASTP